MKKTDRTAPRNIDEYISRCPRDVQETLKKIRETIRKAAPDAEEAIKYQFKENRERAEPERRRNSSLQEGVGTPSKNSTTPVSSEYSAPTTRSPFL